MIAIEPKKQVEAPPPKVIVNRSEFPVLGKEIISPQKKTTKMVWP